MWSLLLLLLRCMLPSFASNQPAVQYPSVRFLDLLDNSSCIRTTRTLDIQGRTKFTVAQLAAEVAFAFGTITDAAPSEYPYVVKIQIPAGTYAVTTPAMVVSSNYILTSRAGYSPNPSLVTVTDQQGGTRPVVNGSSVATNYVWWKVCKKFSGAKYPMTAGSFNNISSTITNAEMLFYRDDSSTLKKMSITVLNHTSCETLYPGTNQRALCVERDLTPRVCLFFTDDLSGSSRTYVRFPMVAIDGQVHAIPANPQCDSSLNNTAVGTYNTISSARSDILAGVPVVDIQ